MFKKLILSVFLAFSTPVLGQEENVPIPFQHPSRFQIVGLCGPIKDNVKELEKQNQKLIWFAENNGNTYMLYRNPEKKDWYLVVIPKAHPELACQLLDGEDSEVNIPKEGKEF